MNQKSYWEMFTCKCSDFYESVHLLIFFFFLHPFTKRFFFLSCYSTWLIPSDTKKEKKKKKIVSDIYNTHWQIGSRQFSAPCIELTVTLKISQIHQVWSFTAVLVFWCAFLVSWIYFHSCEVLGLGTASFDVLSDNVI